MIRDWNHFQYFCAVGRQGNVSRAAHYLKVSHATVLRHIDQLEKTLDKKLFDKRQTGYTLTQEGRLLFDRVAVIHAEIESLTEECLQASGQVSGTLRVSQPDNDVINLYPLYKKFRQQYPGIKLSITSTPEVANLNQRIADVAIRFTHQPDDLLVGKHLGNLGYGAYASQSYLDQLPPGQDLSDFDWLIWHQANRPIEESLQYQWVKKHVRQPQITLRASSIPDLISAMKAGMGVSFISHEIARSYPMLIQIKGIRINSHYPLWILTHRDLKQVPKVACFMRFIKAEFDNRNTL